MVTALKAGSADPARMPDTVAVESDQVAERSFPVFRNPVSLFSPNIGSITCGGP